MMGNFLANLRMRNLYPVPEVPDPSQPPVNPVPQIDNTAQTGNPYDVAARMAELYTPETAATDHYNSLAQNAPQYENPSFLRTIGAALSAFGPGGHKTGQEVMNWHNNQNQQDWKMQLDPAQKAADNERQSNANERVLAHTTVSNELRARADNEKAINNEKVNAIRKQRAAVYEFKAKNPNMKIISAKGGNIIAVDPTNPTKVITLTDEDGKPISSGMLSDTDKINLQQENALERDNNKVSGQIEVDAAKQPGRTELAETRGWQVATIPDPNDPTRQIGVRVNQVTGETVPIQFNGQNTPIGKPGGPVKPGTGAPGVDPAARLKLVQDKARETKTVVDELIDKDGNLTDVGKWGVGANRMLGMHNVSGTKAYKANTAINTLKSKLIINIIEEMKAQSRTGATGFGAMNIKELGVLENAIGQLDPNMPEEDFAKQLVMIRQKMDKILQPTDSFNPTSTVKPPTKKTLEQLKKEYNF